MKYIFYSVIVICAVWFTIAIAGLITVGVIANQTPQSAGQLGGN